MANQTQNSLASRAMLVTLNIRGWQATRTDRKVSDEVARSHKVDSKRAGRYRKHAIDPDAPTYAAYVKASGEQRRQFYHYTLPFLNDGARILNAAAFQEFSDVMRHATQSTNTAAKAFQADLPNLKAKARADLNGMFSDADYPADIASKFGVSLSFAPLPDADDFRCHLADADVAAIKASITADMQDAITQSMRDPYERIQKHLARVVDRLSDPENTFKDTIVTGLRELVEIVPVLNVTGDANLTAVAGKCAALVRGVDAQDLRDDMTKREQIAREASDIMTAMAGFMGGAP